MTKRPFIKRLKRGIREILGWIPKTPVNTDYRDEGGIRAADLIASTTIEEFNAAAEAYYAGIKEVDFQMAKPFSDLCHAPQTLVSLGFILEALNLKAGMRILDFGPGACGISRMLTQMGLRVICLDVSHSALKIGQKLYQSHPPIGRHAPPRFIVYDGRYIPLNTASVDRILVFDAFHHVVNQDDVIEEFHRILVPGGVAGFCEPGPHHSQTALSQSEMRTYRVLENDIEIEKIHAMALHAGFDRMQMLGSSPSPYLMEFDTFQRFLDYSDLYIMDDFIRFAKSSLQELRIFFLHKAGQTVMDSRSAHGLRANIEILDYSGRAVTKQEYVIGLRITNSGEAIWLPSRSAFGPVLLGIHLKSETMEMIDLDYFRASLPESSRGVYPGETCQMEIRVPAPSPGRYHLELDMVAEYVTWFATTGSLPVYLSLEVFPDDSLDS